MTKKEAEKIFIESAMPSVKQAYEQDGKPDHIARSEEWNNFTDALCKNGEITLRQYENWTHPRICGK
jgi:hypothetical protein